MTISINQIYKTITDVGDFADQKSSNPQKLQTTHIPKVPQIDRS